MAVGTGGSGSRRADTAERSDRGPVERRVFVHATPRTVWATLHDPAATSALFPELRLGPAAPPWPAAATTRSARARLGLLREDARVESLEARPDSRFRLRVTASGFDSEWSWRLEPVAGGTRVIHAATFEPFDRWTGHPRPARPGVAGDTRRDPSADPQGAGRGGPAFVEPGHLIRRTRRQRPRAAEAVPPTREPMTAVIKTERLTKSYGAHRGIVELDLEVAQGETFGFLGPNGAGKTTTMRVLLDLIRPTSGRAEVFGIETTVDPVAIHRRIGYLPGEFDLYDRLTGADTIAYFGNLRGGVDRAYVARLVEALDLDPSRRFKEYSKGNKQKVGLIVALQHRPDLLILDEPTAGLDPLVQQTFFALVREAHDDGRTIFLSSHIIDEVDRTCERVAIIREGRLVQVDRIEAIRAARLPPRRADVSGAGRTVGLRGPARRQRCRGRRAMSSRCGSAARSGRSSRSPRRTGSSTSSAANRTSRTSSSRSTGSIRRRSRRRERTLAVTAG